MTRSSIFTFLNAYCSPFPVFLKPPVGGAGCEVPSIAACSFNLLLLFSFTFVLDWPPSLKTRRLSLTRKGEASNYYPCVLILLVSFPFSVSQLCYLYVCSIISLQRLQIRSTPPEDHSRREAHSTFSYSTLCTFTPLFCFVLLCFVLFCFVSHSRSVSVRFEIALTPPEHVSQNRACRSLGRSWNVAKCCDSQPPP